MRQNIKDFAEICAKHLPVQGPVYEFGALQVPGQEGFANLRPMFSNVEYVGVDMREGPGVDKVLNLHDIDLPDDSVGAVVCLDTLEHVEYPRKALDEILRILKPGGMVIMTSVMKFPIHDFPYDYWRYTPEAFRSLLQKFESSFVGSAGVEDFPHTVVAVGFNGPKPDMASFESDYALWAEAQNHRAGMSLGKWLRRMLVPPILSKSSRREMGLTRRYFK